MPLNVGELVGTLRFEDRTEEGVRAALAAARRLFATGADAAVRAFTDRVGAGVGSVDDELGRAGDRAGRRFGDSLSDWLDPLPDDFRDAGDDAGRRFGDEAAAGADGAADGFADAGTDAGEAFGEAAGDEAESKGEGKLSGWLSGLGGKLAAGAALAGAAIGGAIAVGVGGALERQQGEGLLQAQLGLSDEQAGAAGRAAANVFGNGFGENLGGVQEAVGAVWSTLGDSMGDGEDALERATERALTLAQVMGVDVSTAVNTAGIAVKSGLAKDATEAFDLMTAASQQMPAEMRGELIPAVDEYGTFLNQLGITGSDAFGLLANASQDGAIGLDKTGDALKELTIRASDMSASSLDAYKAMGLDAEEMAAKIVQGGETAKEGFNEIVDGLLGIEDPVAQANAAVGLFGEPLNDLGTAEIPAFLQSLDTMGAGMEDVAGRTDQAATDIADDAGSKFETFKRKARMAFDEFVGGKILGPLEQVADRVGPLWGGVAEAFRTDGISGAANKLGEIWDQAWPVMERKAGELFERSRQWVIDNAPEILGDVGDLGSRVWDWLQEAYPEAVRRWTDLLGRVANWVAEEGVPIIGGWLKGAGPALWQWLQDAYPDAVKAMGGLLAAVGLWLVETGVPWMATKGFELWSALGEWLWTDAAPALISGLLSLLGAAAVWITENGVPWIREKGGELWGKLVETAGEKGGELLGWLGGLIGSVATWITDTAVPEMRLRAGEWFGEMLSVATQKGTELVGWFMAIPGHLVNALEGLVGMISAPFIEAFNAIAGAWNSTIGSLSWEVPDWVPGIGGQGIDVPSLPTIEGRASGGPVRRGTPYIVGEEGPELFVPGAFGSIIPNGRTSSILGGIGTDLGAMLSSIAAGLNADVSSAMANVNPAPAGRGWGNPTILVEVHSQVDSHLDGHRIGTSETVHEGFAQVIGSGSEGPVYRAITRRVVQSRGGRLTGVPKYS